MTLANDFERYDSCTADALEIGDLIFISEGGFVELNVIEDKIDVIYVEGYSFSEDDDIKTNLQPEDSFDLYRWV